MSAFSKYNGIYSSKLGLYMYAVALQGIIGYFMLLVSPNKLNIGQIIRARTIEDIKAVGFDLLQGAGAVHVAFACLAFVLLILSHFVTACFKLPMMVITVSQTAYCGITASVCAVYMQKGYSSITGVLEMMAKQVVSTVSPKLDELLVENRNSLFTIGVLAVIAASLFHKAQTVKGTDHSTQVMVVIPCISLGLGVAFALTAPCRDYRSFSLGLIWSLVCITGDIVGSLSRVFCFKPFKFLMLAVYGAICVLSVVTIGVCTTVYTSGRIDSSGYLDIIHGTVRNLGNTGHDLANYDTVTTYLSKITTQYTNEQLNVFMGNGVYFLVIISLSIVCLLFSILSLLYTVFRFFDKSGDAAEHNASSDKNVKIVVA
ncbi:uncharacterized protein BcabD6B2_06610 [Babesia caballi]|uniref:Transmembrane protein, putative n=1 Tax=Babesia caballi TaxID=5871 RepID=A0AAV4LQ06_BABCB|nr:transmembrane protein, putative [Babesia caballi]